MTVRKLIVGLSALPILVVAAMAGNSLVHAFSATNPGFETGNLNGWTAQGPVAAVQAADGEVAYFGSHYARVVTDESGAAAATCPASLEQTFSLAAGETLRGAAYFKALDPDNFNDTGEVRIVETATVLFAADHITTGSTGWIPWTFTAPAAGTYTVRAEASAFSDCLFPSPLGLDIDVPVDLGISISSSPLVPSNGATVTHRVRVRNIVSDTGLRKPIPAITDAPNAVMTLNLASYSAITPTTVPAGWSCGVAGTTVTCTHPLLAPGKSWTFAFTGVADPIPDGRPKANGTIAADATDINPKNNSAVAQATLN